MLKDKKIVYTGRIVTLETACASLPNGHSLDMEVVRHPGGSAVVAVNERREVCLLKQYRCVLDQWLWELPAGKIDNNEPPFSTAQRELEEEAGVQAAQWRDLGFMISSPGVFTEKVYLYLAMELRDVGQNNEDHEVFEVHWVGLEQALSWAVNGEISDAKSIIGLCRAGYHLGINV
jgi:8-oxo-dGTP pyrophosphatase MutT (NUDIX family)